MRDLNAELSPYHHLLGHPQLIQKDMRGSRELIAHRMEWEGHEDDASEQVRTLLEGAAEKWELLLQHDSDFDIEWCWGAMVASISGFAATISRPGGSTGPGSSSSAREGAH